jgi:hypothetical protein
VPAFTPLLVSLATVDGIVAAAGYRPAQHGRSTWSGTDSPIEAVLAAHAEVAPSRADVVEYALDTGRAGAGRAIMFLWDPISRSRIRIVHVTQELRHLLRMALTAGWRGTLAAVAMTLRTGNLL